MPSRAGACLAALAGLSSVALALDGPGPQLPPWAAFAPHVAIQQTDVTCGPAALSNLLRFQFGAEISEAEIVAAILRGGPLDPVRARGGFSLLDLAELAEARGFRARGLRGLDLDGLRAMLPAIVPLAGPPGAADHFVVVLGANGTGFAVADPAAGWRWLHEADLARQWTGVALGLSRP